MIKYYQNGLQPEYGEDHTLSNNWDAEKNYGGEYAEVYFRINTPSYDFNDGWEDGGKEFVREEVHEVFTSLGWTLEADYHISGSCATYKKGKAHLYMHPNNYSGEVLKNDIKVIAEAIRERKTFSLRWVDIYRTVYDLTDEEYAAYLNTRNDEIRDALFNVCSTNRRTHYRHAFSVCRVLAEKFRLSRIGENDGRYYGSGQTAEHIMNIIMEMIDAGWLVSHKEGKTLYVRSINKTEQKEKKMFRN